jgi:hypothetical protein
VEQRFSRPPRGNFENWFAVSLKTSPPGEVHCELLSVKSLETAHLE